MRSMLTGAEVLHKIEQSYSCEILYKMEKVSLKAYLRQYFDMSENREKEEDVVKDITSGVTFKGANLWILICAVFIASLGLNINSTAVIIGAMLISPLMGPILGMGLAVGIDDLPLLRRAVKNYMVATIISIITATIYFFLITLPRCTIRVVGTYGTYHIRCSHRLLWWCSRYCGSLCQRQGQCDSRCGDCHGIDATAMYGRIWYCYRELSLFCGCFVIVLHQYRLHCCGNHLWCLLITFQTQTLCGPTTV